MESTNSPPLTPIRQYMSPIDTSSPSPTHSYREQLRRRTSSFSSNHDRSPVTNRHRFSGASQLSTEFGTPVDGGMGNLADELDQMDNGEDDDFEEGESLDTMNEKEAAEKEEASRDSGIDVSYRDAAKNRSPNSTRNFSKPFCGTQEKPPDDGSDEEPEDKFSPELEDLMSTIARMTSYTSTSEDPLFPRAIAQLQDLGNQSSLEAATQRLTTSTNSMTAHLSSQSKSLQTLTHSLFPMFAFSAPLDLEIIEQALPLTEELQTGIPQPDMVPAQKLQKLDRETSEVIHALSQITDTLQMGKQITNTAARHLRNTQTMVLEMRREREKAELAQHELGKSDWEDKVKRRWCGSECHDIISGFEERCNALRGSLEEASNARA